MHPMVNLKIPLLLVTLLSIGGAAAYHYYHLSTPLEDSAAADRSEPAEPAPPAAAETEPLPVDLSMIAERNLFASKETDEGQADGTDSSAAVEPTTLAVALMGTVTGIENDHRAIIYDKRKRTQEMYREGDSLQGALITDISYGKVIISLNGKNEFLDIAEARKINVPQVSKPGAADTVRRVAARPAGGSGAPAQVQSPTRAVPTNPNAARARQIRAYRSRTLPVRNGTAQ